MKEKKITLAQAVELSMEISGLNDSFPGLLSEPLSMKTKYELFKFSNSLNGERSFFERERIKLFEKYGEEKDGSMTILPENVETYRVEYGKLQSTEVVLNMPEISIEDLDFKSDHNYPLVFTFLIK